MKLKKLIFCGVMCIIIYGIYCTTTTNQITYLSLGDSLALGENAYGDVQYGYSDFIASYLKRNDMLAFYSKDFAKSGARIGDLENSIFKNEKITVQKKQYAIKELLREADLVTVSIGANDLLSDLSLSSMDSFLLDEEKMLEKIDAMLLSLDELFQLLQKYMKGKVIVVGYYNPLHESDAKVNRLFSYLEKGYEEKCERYHFTYLSIRTLFENHQDYLPNPFNIHPGNQGYQAIANQIIDELEDSFLK